MILFLRRVWAFVARDWRLELSYRMQFFLRILSILIVVTTLFFISKIFAGFTDPRFEQWRDPLAAWLTGLAVLNYFMTGFSSLANAIRQEQVQGTLESVLMTPTSFAMVFKRGDPFGIFLGTGSALFSGVFFPTQLVSQYAGSGVASISRILPATYGLDGIRRVLIVGQGLSQVREPLVTLLVFLAVLLPFSLWVFGRAVRRAKREGSLIQY